MPPCYYSKKIIVHWFLLFITMGYTAGWRLSLLLWAFFLASRESVLGKFGLIRLEKGEIFWRKTLTLFIELQRTKHNSTIKYPWAAYPFVLEVRINFRESLHTFYGFNFFSQTVIDFDFHLKHYSILRALKRDLKLDILITVSRNPFYSLSVAVIRTAK